MSDLPGISCFCSTYGRPRALLENSIQCFLDQDYTGPKELVILNDFEGQELVFDHPEVRIFNESTRIKPLGRKFNKNVSLCRYPFVAVWEDDDIFLRHRLSYSIKNIRNGIFHSHEGFFERRLREIEVSENYYHSQHLFSRELFDRVGGYDEADICSIDLSIMSRFREVVGNYSHSFQRIEDRFYVYVWSGAGSFHGSGMGISNSAISDAAASFVAQQVAEGIVETGTIELKPRLRYDIYSFLPTPGGLYRPDNIVVEYGVLGSGLIKDVTPRVASLCAENQYRGDSWMMPADDVARARIFGDPAPNVLKQVIVRLPERFHDGLQNTLVLSDLDLAIFSIRNGQLTVHTVPVISEPPRLAKDERKRPATPS